MEVVGYKTPTLASIVGRSSWSPANSKDHIRKINLPQRLLADSINSPHQSAWWISNSLTRWSFPRVQDRHEISFMSTVQANFDVWPSSPSQSGATPRLFRHNQIWVRAWAQHYQPGVLPLPGIDLLEIPNWHSCVVLGLVGFPIWKVDLLLHSSRQLWVKLCWFPSDWSPRQVVGGWSKSFAIITYRSNC
jgi:hypothetical protein